jgi:hypothetical protein
MIQHIALAYVVAALSQAPWANAPGECGVATIGKNFGNSSVAVLGRVVEASGAPVFDSASSILAGFDQTIRVQVMRSWKGPYTPDTAFTATVRVVTVCGGFGCAQPLKVGEQFVLLSQTTSLELDKLWELDKSCRLLRGTDSQIAQAVLNRPGGATP